MENPNVQAKMKKTKEIVLRAIEDLRPYLHNDGGDMEVVEITKDNQSFLTTSGLLLQTP